jgi:hypothetical protein
MSNKLMKIGIISLLVIAMVFIMPVAATSSCGGSGGFGGDGGNCNTANGNGIIVDGGVYQDIDYNSPLTVENENTNINTNLNVNHNDNTNINTNTNINLNLVDVDQKQKQEQEQQQQQKQQQFQVQKNVQTVNIDLPKGADGGLLISNSNKAPTVTQLDVGESKVFSRLVYPGEVLTFDVNNGDVIGVKSSSDIGFYTIGFNVGDDLKVGSSEATPSYDPFYHKMQWGLVVPVEFTNYWTTKATITAGLNSKQVVVDNRAPRNSYTHIELTVTGGVPEYAPAPEPTPVPMKADMYPTDAYGHAITS